MIVISKTAQTLELRHLVAHMLHGIVRTVLPQLHRFNGTAFHADRLHSLQLDGQTVGVPAGHIGGAEAAHILVLNDKILEHLVERRAQMDLAVGIGRTVMQHILGLAFVACNHFPIEIFFLPVCQGLRLTLGQVSPHREIGFGQIQCLVIILWHGHSSFALLFFCPK